VANGIRASRREKTLSKPVEDKKPPSGWTTGSGRFLKTHAHQVERRIWSKQLVEMAAIALEDLKEQRKRVNIRLNDKPDGTVANDWMRKRSESCRSVTVSARRVYFSVAV